MNLVRFNPYRNVNQSLVDQLFENFLRNDYQEDYLKNSNSRIATNIFETDEGFKLEMLLPGFKKEDLQLKFHENVLTVKVELPEKGEGEEPQYTYVHREFDVFSFERKFRIPKTVDAEKISAQFENGVLVLELAKKAEALPKPAVDIKIN